MIPTSQRILELTLAVAEAAVAGDIPRCDALLTERGEAVRRLGELHAASGCSQPSNEVRDNLRHVQELDRELERSWTQERDLAGRELDRIASRPKQKHGTEAPCIIDRQA